MAQRCPPTSRWSRTSSLSCPVEVMMPLPDMSFGHGCEWSPQLWRGNYYECLTTSPYWKKPGCMEKCSWYLASKACSRWLGAGGITSGWYSPFRIKVKWAFPGHGVTDRAVACSANDPSLILLSSKLLSPLGHKVVRFKKEPKVIGDRLKPA